MTEGDRLWRPKPIHRLLEVDPKGGRRSSAWCDNPLRNCVPAGVFDESLHGRNVMLNCNAALKWKASAGQARPSLMPWGDIDHFFGRTRPQLLAEQTSSRQAPWSGWLPAPHRSAFCHARAGDHQSVRRARHRVESSNHSLPHRITKGSDALIISPPGAESRLLFLAGRTIRKPPWPASANWRKHAKSPSGSGSSIRSAELQGCFAR